jgi:hypothetical protein|tara:strand:- start:44 stop:286 length:243 start_codon:yes stop_codon:yes gene_type:complete
MNGDPDEGKLDPPHKIIDDLFKMINSIGTGKCHVVITIETLEGILNQVEYLRIRLSQPDYPDYPSHGNLAPPCQCCNKKE